MKQQLVQVSFRRHEAPLTGLCRASSRIVSDVAIQKNGDALPNVKKVHLLRVTVKRLRAYLRLLQPSLDKETYRRENLFLRDVGRSLSATRDRQVALRTLDRLEDASHKPSDIKALRCAGKALSVDAATRELEEPSNEDVDEKLSAVLASLQESIDRLTEIKAHTQGWTLLQAGLGRTYGGARRRYLRWLKSGDIHEAHDCRKLVKYLMFQLELIEPANQEHISGFRRKLRVLEKQLGRLNDCVILSQFIERASDEGQLSGKQLKRVHKQLRRRQKAITSLARDLGKKTLKPKPGKVLGRLEQDWRTWQAR